MTSANAISPKEATRLEEGRAIRALLDAGQIALVEVDSAHQITLWSAAAELIFGWEVGQIIGRKISLLAADESLEGCLVSASDDGVSHFEVSCQTKEGRTMLAEIWARQIQSGSQRLVLIIRDVTESRFLEHAFLDAADREQRRIGQEMHDHLCQHILGAAFAVKALAGDLDREGSRHAEQLHDLARLVNEAVSQVRDISRSLHPGELESGGLRSAIQGLADRITHTIPCEFHCAENVSVAAVDSALHAYRIAQEAVLHALQHTGATKVAIHLSAKGGSIRLEIADNGQKEGPATADPDHFASKTLRYRAKAIRGRLRLKFHSGVGTNITCTFPQTS